jgi:hypothetical protein
MGTDRIFRHKSSDHAEVDSYIYVDISTPQENCKKWEELLAYRKSNNTYQIACVPFFAYDLSWGDEVETHYDSENHFEVFRIVTKPSGHYTFRVTFRESKDPLIRKQASEKLLALGCQLEWFDSDFLAIDAPPNRWQPIADFLWESEKSGQFQYETGRLSNDMPSNGQVSSPMTDDEYASFIQTCRGELLELVSQSKKKWGLDKYAKFDFEGEEGRLVFWGFKDYQLSCKVQIIGTLSNTTNTWLWAWDNSSIGASLKVDSIKVRDFGLTNGLEGLAKPTWPATEEDAWDMTAIAIHVNPAEGVYRAPIGDVVVFMILKQIRKNKRAEN